MTKNDGRVFTEEGLNDLLRSHFGEEIWYRIGLALQEEGVKLAERRISSIAKKAFNAYGHLSCENSVRVTTDTEIFSGMTTFTYCHDGNEDRCKIYRIYGPVQIKEVREIVANKRTVHFSVNLDGKNVCAVAVESLGHTYTLCIYVPKTDGV